MEESTLMQACQPAARITQSVATLISSCPLCAADQLNDLYVTRDRHYGIAGSYRVVKCANCSIVLLNPMYSDDALAAFYPSDYYAYQDQFQSNRWRRLTKRLLGYSKGTKEPSFPLPGRVLDLGCGSGWFLEELRSQGWDAYGVEISESASDLGRKLRNLKIFRGALPQAQFPSGFFDYVRANHSFEHISCPNETLDEIRRILKPHGKLLIGVPNIGSFNARLFKRYWWHLCAPVHAFSYSADTLCRMLAKHDFRVEKVTFNSDYFGIIGSLQIWLNRKTARKSMEGRLVNNYFLRFACQWFANFMDLARTGDMIEVTAVKA
jgi:SAM-dependent methyltransferase